MSARTFRSLRERSAPSSVSRPEEPIESVLRRIFVGNPDGERLKQHLESLVVSPPLMQAGDCALREWAGKVRLVNDLFETAFGPAHAHPRDSASSND